MIYQSFMTLIYLLTNLCTGIYAPVSYTHLDVYKRQRIQFTVESEADDQLAFLDVLVLRRIDGRLAHNVYRESITATFTNCPTTILVRRGQSGLEE